MTKRVEHVHKFKRLKYKSGGEIYFCALPDCEKKISTKLVLGKRSLCWRCNQPFIMSEYSIRLARPHCDACHRAKKEITPKVVLTLEERFKQMTEMQNQSSQSSQLNEEDEI